MKDIDVARKMMQLKTSANSRGIEYDMSFKKTKQLLTRKTYYFTGVNFEEEGILQRSIDRLDSSKGYTDDNVVACTVDINNKKGCITPREIKQLYNGLKKSNLI